MFTYCDFFTSQNNGFSRKHRGAFGKKECEIFNANQSPRGQHEADGGF